MGQKQNIGNSPKIQITRFRAEDYLRTERARAAYLREAMLTGDREFIILAKRTVANARREARRKRA